MHVVPLNTHCVRETQHIVTPYKQARIVPAGTWRTVTDTWNGYHSFPLAEEVRYLITFIIEYGRYRYKMALQCYLASGYGYNLRYDNSAYNQMPLTNNPIYSRNSLLKINNTNLIDFSMEFP